MENPQKPDIIAQCLVNKLDTEGVCRLRSVELAVAFSRGKTMTPEEFAQVYDSCFEFISNNLNKHKNG